MDLRKLKTLIDLVSESGISELEVTEGESKVHIVKHAPPVYIQSSTPPILSPDQSIQANMPTIAAESAHAAATPPDYIVKSSIVGIVYRAPSPGAEPFVKVGSTVKEEQTLCIIEAMKMLTEIKAEQEGTIKEICFEDGQAVDYGQPLFVLRI